MEENKKKDKDRKIDLVIKIVLIIIIILLLIRNCLLLKENNGHKNTPLPGGNIDIIEIKCNDNECDEIENISFSQEEFSVKKDSTIKLIPIVKPSSLSSDKLTWTSSDLSIATVDGNGVVKGLKEGTVTITVTASNGIVASCVVTVVLNDINVEKIKLTPNESVIKNGTITQVIAEISPKNATNRDLIWTSSDPKIAIVDANGYVKGLKEGTVTITAKTKDGKVVASTTISIQENLIESISFSQENISVKKDNTVKLVPIIKPSSLSSSKLTWTSSDSSVATVDENGIVKGLKNGTTTITVTTSSGMKASCIVTVTTDNIDVKEIKLTPNESVVKTGSTTQVIAEIIPNNATNRDLIWESSNPSIATVDGNGIVKGLKSGTITITAKTKDGKVVASTTITIETTGSFDVYDKDHTPLTWNGSNDLNIFTKSAYAMEGKIAPESSNVYQFMIRNTTDYKLKYKINFIETNSYHINMKYKLKKNDTYLVDHYVSANELNIDNMIINISENDTYYLEWKWISSDNDNSIGANPEAKYGIRIEVEADGING